MKKQVTNRLICTVWMLMGFLSLAIAQVSTNTVKYKVTYNETTQTYTAWVVPDYNVPNANNGGSIEKGATAQFTIVVPKDFVITQITDIKGTWIKPTDAGFRKLGPGNAGQTWTGLNPALNYYVIGKNPVETDYGSFSTGTAVALFSFKGNGCMGPIQPLGPNDAFIAAADNTYSLNVANSFYSLSGQAAGGNQSPRDQFVNTTGTPAVCFTASIYAYDDNNITLKGGVVAGNVLRNDDKASGTGPLMVATTLVQAPSSGTVVLNANGNYIYTPTSTFVGTATFKYRVCDSGNPAVCDTATVSIVVREPLPNNNPPIALGDNVATKAEAVVRGNVLNNDQDIDAGQTLTATLVTMPMYGTLTLNADGNFVYTPKAGYYGDDYFLYRACDNSTPQVCSNARVDLNVYNVSVVNLPALTNDDLVTRSPSGFAVGNVLINDKDPDGGALQLKTTPIVGPTNGTVVLNTDGTFTYRPNTGHVGVDQFTYEVCDTHNPSGCSQATVYIVPNSSMGTADLGITKMAVGNRVLTLGETATFKVVVKNLGPNFATNIVVKDSMSAGLKLLGGTPTTGSFTASMWTIPVLASGDSAVLTITAKLMAEGVSFNYSTIKNVDQTDPDDANNEAEICVSVPMRVCPLEALEVSVPASYTNVVWFKNSQEVAKGNVVLLSELGVYTFTATNSACPAGGCCPVIVEAGTNCCPTNLCIPFKITKKKKK